MIDNWPEIKLRSRELVGSWETVSYHRHGEEVAGALVRGTEIHFMISPEHRGRIFPRRVISEFIAPIFNRSGYLTTRCKPDDALSIRFVTRVGFVKTWHDGLFDHFMLTEIPFSARK